MIDSSGTAEKDLRADEALLEQLQQEELSVETASHHGFVDASRRARLAAESELVETKIRHEKQELADDHD
jgi:hypothetical protein